MGTPQARIPIFPHISGQIGTIPSAVFRPFGGIALQNTTVRRYKLAQGSPLQLYSQVLRIHIMEEYITPHNDIDPFFHIDYESLPPGSLT